MKKNNLIFVVSFFFLCVLPMVVMLVRINRPSQFDENRIPAKFPSAPHQLAEVKSFIQGLENYINDHFGLRSKFVKLSRVITYKLFGTSTSEKVLLGRNGWLFFRGDKSIESFRSIELFNKKENDNWRRFFFDLKNKSQMVKAHLVVMIPPNPTTIYGDQHLPDWLRKEGQTTRLDQIKSILGDLQISFIDLRSTFMTIRDQTPLYYKTDTHWNDIGAFYGYSETMRAIRPRVKAKGFSLSNIHQKTIVRPGGDLATMLGLPNFFSEETISLSLNNSNAKLIHIDGAGPYPGSTLYYECKKCLNYKLVAYRDSYFSSVIPFLSEHFSKSIYVWKSELDWAFIRKEKPDVLLYETAERFLMFSPPVHIN